MWHGVGRDPRWFLRTGECKVFSSQSLTHGVNTFRQLETFRRTFLRSQLKVLHWPELSSLEWGSATGNLTNDQFPVSSLDSSDQSPRSVSKNIGTERGDLGFVLYGGVGKGECKFKSTQVVNSPGSGSYCTSCVVL